MYSPINHLKKFSTLEDPIHTTQLWRIFYAKLTIERNKIPPECPQDMGEIELERREVASREYELHTPGIKSNNISRFYRGRSERLHQLHCYRSGVTVVLH